MGYIGQAPTKIPLTEADIIAGTITNTSINASAAIAQSKLANIVTADITTNQIDETLVKDAFVGDFSDVTVTAADAFLYGDATDSGNTKKDTVQGILDLVPAGGNDPSFLAGMGSTQDIATATSTVIEFDTEVFDSESSYNHSTYIWTPQTAGYYFLFVGFCFNVNFASALDGLTLKLEFNAASNPGRFGYISHFAYPFVETVGVQHFNGSSDYVKSIIYLTHTGGTQTGGGGPPPHMQSRFGGFMIKAD